LQRVKILCLTFVVFEPKETVARVISARDMDKKERKIYKG
jgi:uncharacterized DUF497 family protein